MKENLAAAVGLAILAVALVSCGGDGGTSSTSPTPTYNILEPQLAPPSNVRQIPRGNKMSLDEAHESARSWMLEKGVERFCPTEMTEPCRIGARCDGSGYNEPLHIWLFTCATGIEPLRPGSVLIFEVKVSDDTGFATGI